MGPRRAPVVQLAGCRISAAFDPLLPFVSRLPMSSVQRLLSPVVEHRSPADGRKAVVRSAHANVDSRFDLAGAPNECPLVNRP